MRDLMFKKVLFIFLLLTVSVSFVSASENLTDMVLYDDALSADMGVTGDTFDDVQKSIDDAKENDVIKLEEKNYVCLNKEISINKSITIEGIVDKTVLDANKKPGIIDIHNSNAIIKNIKFINSKGLGAVNIQSSNVTFVNCIFEDNVAGAGGAIRSNGGQTNIINCTFKNNSVDINRLGLGGAIAIISDENSLANEQTNICNSTFLNNSAYDGAAIYIGGMSHKTLKRSFLSIDNTQFKDNFNLYGERYYIAGADISIKLTDFDLTVLNSDFTHTPDNFIDPFVEAFIICADNSYFENSSFSNSVLWFDNGVANFSNCNMDYCVSYSNYLYALNYDDYYYTHPEEYIFNLTFVLNNSNFNQSSLSLNMANINNSSFIKSTLDNSANIFIFKSNFTDSNILGTDGITNIEYCNFNGKENLIDCEDSKLIIIKSNFYDKIAINAPNNKFTNCTGLNNIVSPINVKVISPNLVYNSGTTYKMRLINSNFGNPFSNFTFKVVVYNSNGKKLKTYNLKTGSDGVVSVKGLTKLAAGNYYFQFVSTNEFLDEWEKNFAVKKVKTTVKAPKITAVHKKSKYFKITVKSNKKAIKKVKIKVKVFTGKKYKIYKIKTNKKGVAKLNTKKLSKGKHKVVISSGNKNYKISAKSRITIK